MKISKLTIHNYRSICDIEMLCEPLVVILGPNNHGKSNILYALEFALSTSSKPSTADFCKFSGIDNVLWVELTFHHLTEQERNTFKKYLQKDGGIRIRKTARLDEASSVEILYNGYVIQPEEWWLQSNSVSRLASREEIHKTPLKDFVSSTGRVTKSDVEQAQAAYIERHASTLHFKEILEEGPLLGSKNVGGGVLPSFYLIPAVRDLADETKTKTTTAFGRLLSRAVKEMADTEPRFREIKDGLNKLVELFNRSDAMPEGRPEQLQNLENALKAELSSWEVNVEIEVIPPEIEKIFELGTNLHIDDGVKTLAELKGHGLQRSIIFALIRAWVSLLKAAPNNRDGSPLPRASSESIVFGMEEPELFLHPQAQRKMAAAIHELSQTPDYQVFICTHSTHFVNLEKYKNICIVNKKDPKTGTKVRQCVQELFEGERHNDRKQRFHMARWINPDRGEMFFAKRVAFVEGETEKTMLPFIAEKCGCQDHEISVIDCGSKHNLPLYITIANAFELPYVVVHDEDPLPDPIPDTWTEDKRREKEKTFSLNKEIQELVDSKLGHVEILSPDFEGVARISRTQAEKKGKAFAALEHFEANTVEKYPTRLIELVNAIYCGKNES